MVKAAEFQNDMQGHKDLASPDQVQQGSSKEVHSPDAIEYTTNTNTWTAMFDWLKDLKAGVVKIYYIMQMCLYR